MTQIIIYQVKGYW